MRSADLTEGRLVNGYRSPHLLLRPSRPGRRSMFEVVLLHKSDHSLARALPRMTRPTRLRTEHRDGAVLGLGVARPRLSWQLPPGAARPEAHPPEGDGPH